MGWRPGVADVTALKTPAQVHLLDQSGADMTRLLGELGADLRDPRALAGAVAAVEAITVLFTATADDLEREGVVEGMRVVLRELQR